MRKRILVTGGTGFIGASLVRRLLNDGHEVHLVLREVSTTWRIDEVLHDLHRHTVDFVDLRSTSALLLALRPDWIFHLAVYGAYPQQTDAPEMVRTNITGTISLVDAAVSAGIEAFVNSGTSSEYGFKDHAPAEDEALQPNSAYAVSKAAATFYAQYAARRQSAPVVTLRLYSAYGPYEAPTRLMPQLLVRSRAHTLPPLVDPDVARDYVYVDDVVEAYIKAASEAARHSGAIYNIGTGRQTSLRQVVEAMSRLRGVDLKPQWGTMPRRQWDTSCWVANVERARRELGWEARTDLQHGVARMAHWLEAEPHMLERYQRSP